MNKKSIIKKVLVGTICMSMLGVMAVCGATEAQASMTLKVGSTFNEGSILCDSLEHMCQLVEEKSNGEIQFERFYGGTLYTLPEEFTYLQQGAIDLASPMQGTASQVMPLWQVGANGKTASKGVDISNYVANVDETTSPLLQAEAEAAGVHAFGFNIGDYNVIVCRSSASSISDLQGRAFGIPAQGAAVYEAMGLNVVTCETADAYESLSRGVVDCFAAGISSVTSMKLYETAESCLVLPATGGTGICMMNINTWNSLTAEQQDMFTEAYEETIEWMKERYDNELLPAYEEEISSSSTLTYIEGEELDNLINVKTDTTIAQYESAAEIAGVSEEYELVQTTAKEYADKINAEE
jgi:TRAP-type transport system periplasmic protein